MRLRTAIGRTWPDFGDDLIFAVPHLMVEPAPTIGLTMHHVAAMEQFAANKKPPATARGF